MNTGDGSLLQDGIASVVSLFRNDRKYFLWKERMRVEIQVQVRLAKFRVHITITLVRLF